MTVVAAERSRPNTLIAPVTLGALAAQLPAIDLQAVLELSALQTRRDRKYLLPKQTLARMFDDLGADLSCLEISGDRAFAYRSVYFDTADLEFFRQHAQGRRRRIKVRTRTYVDSEICFMEVKSKGMRGVTVKDRIPYPIENSDLLTREAEEFVARVTDAAAHAGNLHPSLESHYRRLTLVDQITRDRVTCDEDLRFLVSGREVRGLPEEVLVATKTAGPPGPPTAGCSPTASVRTRSASTAWVSGCCTRTHGPTGGTASCVATSTGNCRCQPLRDCADAALRSHSESIFESSPGRATGVEGRRAERGGKKRCYSEVVLFGLLLLSCRDES